ncbi:NAC transcription factor NAM-B2 [Acorus calamus]|uniref:NAC transcription factor NAM-B2 n=1 Tax=Acorus calamus TaxID=4465 RepID=A0AAV9ECN6_ACOCL|nr:NAC transcription factor NAM-B2 [Acorus calamus]
MGDETTNLPPGFRFFPTDEELVVHFLHRKASMLPCHPDIIPILDLHRFDPWELQGKALAGGNQLYFFQRGGMRTRASANGVWKLVSSDEPVVTGENKTVGIKKTMVFQLGEALSEMKTNWIMHEYHLLESGSSSSRSSSKKSSQKRGNRKNESDEWVLCRVYDASEEGIELSCLDEVFLSLDDLDEVSLPK